MGGVPTCSLCYFWAFKLAVLGNCYYTYIAKFWSRYGNVILKLWTELIESLVKIGRAFLSDSFFKPKFCTFNVRKYNFRHYFVIEFAYYILKSICNKKICKNMDPFHYFQLFFLLANLLLLRLKKWVGYFKGR